MKFPTFFVHHHIAISDIMQVREHSAYTGFLQTGSTLHKEIQWARSTLYKRTVVVKCIKQFNQIWTSHLFEQAIIIAFSSNFIPLLVYQYSASPNHTDQGFLNFSLSYFDTSEFQENSAPYPGTSFGNVSMCRWVNHFKILL